MKIKRILAAAAAAAMTAALTSCGGNGADGGNSADGTVEAAEISSLEVTLTTEAVPAKEYSEMTQRSFVSLGNTCRLENKLAKAGQGEKTTVAYIGGSITEGIGGDAENCYAKLSFNYIAENYGKGDNMEYVNAGVSGTPSVLGNLRVKKDVLDHDPDIVFIEFAVNDGMDKLYKESYESLVRTVLKSENEPAVILLFTVTKTGHTCQEHMSQVGEYYGLPMISVPNAIQPEIEAGRMTWADYSNDEAHPNMEGHRLVAEFIEYYFETLKARNAVDGEESVKPLAVFGSPYENAFLAEADYDNSNENLQITDTGSFPAEARRIADFKKGAWVYDGEGNSPLKMKVVGNSLFFVCKRNKSETMGKFDVYINGEKASTINTNQNDGWGEPFAFQAIKWQGIREMEVEILPSEDSAGKTIEIFGIACTQNEEAF